MSSPETDEGTETGGVGTRGESESRTAMAEWPSLFEEVIEMIFASIGSYAIADVRALARKGKLAEGSDRILDLPLSYEEVLGIMRANESAYVKTKSGDFHDLVKYYDSAGAGAEMRASKRELARVHYVGDENAAQECVYALTSNATRKRIVLSFRGSITVNDWLKDAKTVIGPIPNPVAGMASDQPETVGIHLGFRDYLYGDAGTLLSSSSGSGKSCLEESEHSSEDEDDDEEEDEDEKQHTFFRAILPKKKSEASSSERVGEADDDGGGNSELGNSTEGRNKSAESTSSVGGVKEDEEGDEEAAEKKHTFFRAILPKKKSEASSSERVGEEDDGRGDETEGDKKKKKLMFNERPVQEKMAESTSSEISGCGSEGVGHDSEHGDGLDECKKKKNIFAMISSKMSSIGSERGGGEADEEKDNAMESSSEKVGEDEGPKQTKMEEILDKLRTLMGQYPDYKVYITGHSLGGALALCTALEAAAELGTESRPVTCIAVANPKTGDFAFRSAIEELETRGALRCLCVHNKKDVVPLLPDLLVTGSKNFCHVGIEMRLFHTNYQILRKGGEDDTAANKMSEDFARAMENLKSGRFLSKKRINKHNYREYIDRILAQEEDLRQVYLNDLYREKVDSSLHTRMERSDALRDISTL